MKTTTSQIRPSIHPEEVQDAPRTSGVLAISISTSYSSSVERFVNFCRDGFLRFLSRQIDYCPRGLEPVPVTGAIVLVASSPLEPLRRQTSPQEEASWPAPARLDLRMRSCGPQTGSTSLHGAISSLPVSHRNALRIYYVDGIPEEVVCARIGIGRDEFRALRQSLRERFHA
jgi:hypothetical protein